MSVPVSSATAWFRRVVWLGVVANAGLALPTLVSPGRAIAFSRLPIAAPLLWPQFSALLLILLSAFYVPAAIDPNRYRPVAWLAVGARLAGVIFFVGFQAAEYHLLGYFDLAFFIPEAILLGIVAISGPAVPAAASTGAGR